MARNGRGRRLKPGLDYATIDTDYSAKHKPLQVRKKFGMLGHAMVFEVITWITAKKGWYVEWTENTADDFATTRLFDLSLSDRVNEILLYMTEIEFFSRAAFEKHGVLTSMELFLRWQIAKKEPEKYLPEGSKAWEIHQTLLEEANEEDFEEELIPSEIRQNAPKFTQNDPKFTKPEIEVFSRPEVEEELIPSEIRQNDPKFTQNDPKFTQNGPKLPKGKESTNKQTNKQTKPEFIPAEIPQAENQVPPGDPDRVIETGPVDPIRSARASPGWQPTRETISRRIYEVGLSADLVDALTAAVLHGWLPAKRLDRLLEEARRERDRFDRTDGRVGRSRLWATIRPQTEAIFLAHGAALPPCDKARLEPAPLPREPPQPDKPGETGSASVKEAIAELRRRLPAAA